MAVSVGRPTFQGHVLWRRPFSHNVHNAPEPSPVFEQHETRAVSDLRTDTVWALGYGGGLQGSVYAEMSRGKY